MNTPKVKISATYLIKSLLLLGGIFVLIYYGKSIVMPLFVAAIIAILLDIPLQKLKNIGLPNWLSIALSVLLMVVVFFMLSWLISSQVNNIAEDWPMIKEKATDKLNLLSEWANNTLRWDYKDYIENNKKLIQKAEDFVSSFLSSLINLLSQSLIIFVYIILFLIQKQQFINFFKKLFSDDTATASLLKNIASIVKSYFLGKGKIMLFLFVIYFIGFSLGSVPYALFLALFAALFSIVPYVGNVIGGGVAVVLSFLYAGEVPALIVIGVIGVAQIIENYLLTPWIIGEEINLNPFITIFGVILFSSIWGIVGAVIALPLFGIITVILDHTKGMEAFTYMLKQKEN